MSVSVKFEGMPREMIALRVSREITEGSYVNLGIGIPTLVSNWIEGMDVCLQSEIGMLKTGALASGGDVNQDLINEAAGQCRHCPSSSYFDICESFDDDTRRAFRCSRMGALRFTPA
jgi:3-oxoacid CoA-transferase B subunit